MQSQTHMPKVLWRDAHSPDCNADTTPGHLNSKGGGAGSTQGSPGWSTTRTFWVCAASASHLGGQRWAVSPAAIPAGPSAALCRREGLSAGYHEDPEPAKGKQVEHLKSLTEKARVISGTRETGCGGGGVLLCLWCSKQEHPPLPPQLNDHSVFFYFLSVIPFHSYLSSMRTYSC